MFARTLLSSSIMALTVLPGCIKPKSESEQPLPVPTQISQENSSQISNENQPPKADENQHRKAGENQPPKADENQPRKADENQSRKADEIPVEFLASCEKVSVGAIKGLKQCWQFSKKAIEGNGRDKNTPKNECSLIKGEFVSEKACSNAEQSQYKCDGSETSGLSKYYTAEEGSQLEESSIAAVKSECESAPTLGKWTKLTSAVPAAMALKSAVSVVAGGEHSCAVLSPGGIRCWGQRGTLGDGLYTSRTTPVAVTDLSTGVKALSAGTSHTCALLTSGLVKCWGTNSWRQLGDGTSTDRLLPVEVVGISSTVSAISAGGQHTCALISTGGVKCWGYNFSGELGDGSTSKRLTPVDVNGLTSGVTAISASEQHTCALLSGGGVKCWGNNQFGQLGNNSTSSSSTPVGVTGLSTGVVGISARGSHTCAILSGGGVKCWGDNQFGQLGNNSISSSSTPIPVNGLSKGVTAVSAGGQHTCALLSGGSVKCWGDNQFGQLGDSSTSKRLVPGDVTGLSGGVSALSAGSEHSCAVLPGGGVKCWGYNNAGELGDNSTTRRLVPVDVVLLP